MGGNCSASMADLLVKRRLAYARNSDKSRKWDQSDFRAYNLDLDRVVDFRLYAGNAPYAQDGSLWVDSDLHTQNAAELRAQLVEAKAKLVETRVNLLKGNEEAVSQKQSVKSYKGPKHD